jgi:phosphopantetheine adenylyltransferase
MRIILSKLCKISLDILIVIVVYVCHNSTKKPLYSLDVRIKYLVTVQTLFVK